MNRNEKARQEQARKLAEEKKLELARMPMNKFISSKDPFAKKVRDHMMSSQDDVQLVMRQVKAKYAGICECKNKITQYGIEMASEDIKTKHEDGRKFTKEELFVLVLLEQTKMFGYLADIRQYVTHKLLPYISEAEFTQKHYADYLAHVELALAKRGLKLFPAEYEIIPVE